MDPITRVISRRAVSMVMEYTSMQMDRVMWGSG